MKKNLKGLKKYLAVLLAVALLITGLYAFLSATDTKDNAFTIGNINIRLFENLDRDGNGTFDSTCAEAKVFNPESSLPNSASPYEVEFGYWANHAVHDQNLGIMTPKETRLKQPWIGNTGDNDAFVYIQVGVPKVSTETITAVDDTGTDLFANTTKPDFIEACSINKGNSNSNWKLLGTSTGYDDYNYYLYYYYYPLAAGERTDNLFESITAINYANTASYSRETEATYTAPLTGLTIPEGSTSGNSVFSEQYWYLLDLNSYYTLDFDWENIVSYTVAGSATPITAATPTNLGEDVYAIQPSGGEGVFFVQSQSMFGDNHIYAVLAYDDNGDQMSGFSLSSINVAYTETAIEYMDDALELSVPIQAFGIQTNGFRNSPVEAFKALATQYSSDLALIKANNSYSQSNINIFSSDAWSGNDEIFIADYFGSNSTLNSATVNFYVEDENTSPSSDDPNAGYTLIAQKSVPVGENVGFVPDTRPYRTSTKAAVWTTGQNGTGDEITINTVISEDTNAYLSLKDFNAVTYANPDWFMWRIVYDNNGYAYAFLALNEQSPFGGAINGDASTLPTSGTFILPDSITFTMHVADAKFAVGQAIVDGMSSHGHLYRAESISETSVTNIHPDHAGRYTWDYIPDGYDAYLVPDPTGHVAGFGLAELNVSYENQEYGTVFDSPLVVGRDYGLGFGVAANAKFMDQNGNYIDVAPGSTMTVTVPTVYFGNTAAGTFEVGDNHSYTRTNATITFNGPYGRNNGGFIDMPTYNFTPIS